MHRLLCLSAAGQQLTGVLVGGRGNRYRDVIVCVVMTGTTGLSIVGEIQARALHLTLKRFPLLLMQQL